MIDPHTHFKLLTLPVQHNGKFAINWKVPPDLPYFEGHFPSMAVLPAVAIIDGSLVFLEAFYEKSTPISLTELVSCKFSGAIASEMDVMIQICEVSPKNVSVIWQNTSNQQTLADLRMRVEI